MRLRGIIPAYAGNTSRHPVSWSVGGDHPRICGEHLERALTASAASGSSPHMRGTHIQLWFPPADMGIIPAYAGNTDMYARFSPFAWDHPRICGEHVGQRLLAQAAGGSSPHMRGTPPWSPQTHGLEGIIPAYAGNTLTVTQKSLTVEDHPRICGEHAACSVVSFARGGSSPHMRGTLVWTAATFGRTGIIPAYAGNTLSWCEPPSSRRDHPRICGEHPSDENRVNAGAGSSPHMRGTPKT